MSTADAQKAAVEKVRARYRVTPKLSMLQIQELTAKGPRLKGPFGQEQVSIPEPSEPDLLERVWDVVSSLREDGEAIDRPQYAKKLGGEWTYPLSGNDSGPSGVMLYFHGGSYK